MLSIETRLSEIKNRILTLKDAYDHLLIENNKLKTEVLQLKSEKEVFLNQITNQDSSKVTNDQFNVKLENKVDAQIVLVKECLELLK